ncbi:cation:proton antiporter [Leifsonia sp. NPDC058292]|uniref:cation:proton antiporter n=1 Tax=Leifsonia sp. NPDC058292 TaxID=3346428 RepID=UPI0036DED5BD
MEVLVIIVLVLLAIAGATTLGPKLGVAAPLVLVVVGIAVSFLPFVPALEIEPEWILAGVLPPLLYSASVSMPTMEFRREFGAIGGLSVLLVIVSAVVLGLFFAWVIPGLGLAWGIALGAIVSPTDAVATSIVKRSGVSPRVVAILEGESLLNDASALVLLRTAIAAAAASFSLGGFIGSFAYSVAVALVFGWVVGRLNLIVRARVTDATINTVLSFTVPFLASIPAEALGASGLVAAVVAGLVTGRRGPRVLSPQHRLSDAQNWRTIEVILEGLVFLVMGLELFGIVQDVQADHAGFLPALGVALGALVLTIVVRAAYVAPLLGILAWRSRRGEQMRPRMESMQQRLVDPGAASAALERRGGPGARRTPTAADLGRFATRVRRAIADIDYFKSAPLGWREGTVVVWAGMRGAVTVAAAQTLPAPQTPGRSLLVLIAFIVAAASLLIQGGTLGWVVRRVKPAPVDTALERDERARLMTLLFDAAQSVPIPASTERTPEAFMALREARLKRIRAQRAALLDARDDGAFSADLLDGALTNLDADQISLDLKGAPLTPSD